MEHTIRTCNWYSERQFRMSMMPWHTLTLIECTKSAQKTISQYFLFKIGPCKNSLTNYASFTWWTVPLCEGGNTTSTLITQPFHTWYPKHNSTYFVEQYNSSFSKKGAHFSHNIIKNRIHILSYLLRSSLQLNSI